MATQERGKFVWYELLTTDPNASIPFYHDVVGWDTQKFEGAGVPYTMWVNGEAPIGGVMALPDEAREQGAPPNWLAYVSTPDVDATVKRAKELGGDVKAPPMDIPNVGRMAVLSDPQGAVFAVYKPSEEAPGHEGEPQKGEFSWHELATTDADSAFDFYRDLFGWEKQDQFDMGQAGVYQIYGRKAAGDQAVPLGGMYRKPEEMPAPPHWMLYVRVDDVHEGVERVKRAGGQVLNGPMEVPGGDYIAQCMDPQGAMFALHSRGKSD